MRVRTSVTSSRTRFSCRLLRSVRSRSQRKLKSYAGGETTTIRMCRLARGRLFCADSPFADCRPKLSSIHDGTGDSFWRLWGILTTACGCAAEEPGRSLRQRRRDSGRVGDADERLSLPPASGRVPPRFRQHDLLRHQRRTSGGRSVELQPSSLFRTRCGGGQRRELHRWRERGEHGKKRSSFGAHEKLSQQRSVRVTPAKNRIDGRRRSSSSTPQACAVVQWMTEVGGDSISSAPKARDGFGFSGKVKTELSRGLIAGQFITKVLKVFRAGPEQDDFLDHRRKIRE